MSVNSCSGVLNWNTGETSNEIIVSPSLSTTYSATCTANGTCISGIGQIFITVNAPEIKVNASPSTVCLSGSTVLSLVGCPSKNVYWKSLLDGGILYEQTPTINNVLQSQTFTGFCETSAGISSADVIISVRQAQDFQLSATSTNIVLGESTQISSDVCDGILTWNTGQTGSIISVSPDKTTTYTATCNSSTSCGGKGTITISVKPPQVKIIGENVCFGQNTVLNQEGCTGLSQWVYWKKDDFSDAQPLESVNLPIYERTHFRFTCTTSAGESVAETIIEPIALPNKPEIIPNKESYITGETVELNVLNCNGHLKWSNGEEGINQIRVKPDRTTTYSATCYSGLSCANSSSIEVIIKTDVPKVEDLTLCFGDTLTLQSGCTNGSKAHWTENWFDLPNRIERIDGEKIKLFESKIYAVSCEGLAGYSDAKVISVNVKPKIDAPTIFAKDSIMVKGNSLELEAQSCNETDWKFENSADFHSNKISVKPLKTTTFFARCKVDGCLGEFGKVKILVRPKSPQVTVSADTLCAGNSTTITALMCEDGGKLQWSNGENTGNFTVILQKGTTYKAVCIGLDSTERRPLISDTTIVKIKVYQTPKSPIISASNLVIIEDERTTLKASDCTGIITWNTGETGNNITVSPTKATTYSATCKVWNCVSEKSEITIKVRPKQLEITDGKNTGFILNDTLCLQKQLIVSVVNSCNGTIIWSNGNTGKNLTINGLQNETYNVWCENSDKEISDISTINLVVKDYNISDAYIYPNPTSGKLYIQSKGCIDGVMLRLFTLRGELIYEGSGQERYLDSLVLDLFNLPSEEYVLHIIGTDGKKPVTLRKRVVKTNNN